MAFDPLAAQSELFQLEQPGAAQRQPAKQSPEWRQKIMRLIPLVAAAAKGGPGAMEGLLSGYQQAEAQRQQQAQQQQVTQRQSMLDQRALNNDAFNQQMQTANLHQKQESDRAQLVQEFSKALTSEDLTDPESVRALTQLYEARGQALGVRPGTFETTAMQVVKPSTLEKKAAERKVRELRAQFGVKWAEEGARFVHQLPGRPQPVAFQELLALSGMTPDPAAPQAAPQSSIASDVPLDRQHAMAIASGNQALAKQIEESLRRQDMAKSQPVDPQMAQLNRQIAEMRLENMRSAKDTTGLPPRVQRQVDTLSKGFDTQSITKRTQTMAEAVTFANSLDPNTKNPADDQALIYSFAKAMDPDSVVREGEYATVQKYAQSWAERFGFDVARIFSNTAFLTPQARAQMKTTIQSRYQAARGQYDNVRAEYARRINRITGSNDGDQYLIDYGGGFPGGTTTSTPAGSNPFRK